jgi:hypothetical protein
MKFKGESNMATFEVLSNGDIRVNFPENGTSYTIPGAAGGIKIWRSSQKY